MSMKHPQRYHDAAAKARRRHNAQLKKEKHERRLQLAADKPAAPTPSTEK